MCTAQSEQVASQHPAIIIIIINLYFYFRFQ